MLVGTRRLRWSCWKLGAIGRGEQARVLMYSTQSSWPISLVNLGQAMLCCWGEAVKFWSGMLLRDLFAPLLHDDPIHSLQHALVQCSSSHRYAARTASAFMYCGN